MDKISELGPLLKQRREELNKTIASVVSDTRIREPFIIKIESGEFATLPSYVHSYGFVKQYSEYLGLPYVEIKPLFDKECPKPGADIPVPPESTPLSINESGKPRSKTFLVAVVIFIIAICGYYAYRSYADKTTATPVAQVELVQPAEPAPVVEPIVPVTPPVADNKSANYVNLSEIVSANGNGVPAEPIKDNATPPPPPVLPPVTQYVVLSFTDTCWVSYTPDNGTVEEFTAIAGTVKRVPFIDFFVLNVGNAAALTLKHGTKTLTNFGQPGTVLRNLHYELKNGVIERIRR